MEGQSDFYVTLPSDSSLSKTLFPDNKSESFKVQLPSDLRLEGKWEVSLSEMILPHTWYNFTKDSHITLVIGSGTHARPEPKLQSLFKDTFSDGTIVDIIKVTLPKGSYSSVKQMSTRLNSIIKKGQVHADMLANRRNRNFKFLDLQYDDIQHKANLANGRKKVILFSDDAGGHFRALGTEFTEYSPAIQSDHPAYDYWVKNFKDLKFYKLGKYRFRISKKAVFLNKNPVIFVYCDVIEPQIVGETQVKLLRTVSVTGDFSETTASNFFKNKYLPVRSGYIRTIEMELRDNKGNLINFQSGDVNAELHFRKCHLYK